MTSLAGEGAAPNLLGRLAVALAAASLITAVQSWIVVGQGHALPASLAASHWVLVAALQLLVAALLGAARNGRVWAALAFALPVAMTTGIAEQRLASSVVAGAFLLLAMIWAFAGRAPTSPLLAATAGGVAGALLLRLYQLGGALDAPSLLLRVGAVVLCAAAALGGGRVRALVRPGLGACAGWIALGLGATALASFASNGVGFGFPPPEDHASGAAQPSVVLIVLDTLRADRLALYGHDRVTMPNLEAFAKRRAVVFERSLANGPSSLPTHASMFTGLYPPRHGAHLPYLDDADPPRYAYPLPDDVPTLAELLARAGYLTVGISANHGPLGPTFGLGRGFDHYDATPRALERMTRSSPWIRVARFKAVTRALRWAARMPPFAQAEFFTRVDYRRGEEITRLALEVLEDSGDRPLFLFLNYFDAHAPHDPPAWFRRDSELEIPPLENEVWGRRQRLELRRGDREATPEERAHIEALYRGELAYLDAALAPLLEALEQDQRFAEMLVVITSDHGESLGEHRFLGHSGQLYEELVRVPLIVKPGRATPDLLPVGSRAHRPVQSVDLFAGILAHAGLLLPADIDGRPWGAGRERAFGWLFPPRDLLEEAPDRYARELVYVEQFPWKLIRSSDGRSELYALDSDPDELTRLETERQDVATELAGALEALPPARSRERSAPQRLAPETVQQLRALGYLGDDEGR